MTDDNDDDADDDTLSEIPSVSSRVSTSFDLDLAFGTVDSNVDLWATNNQIQWIMKICKRLQEVPNFRRPVSRAPRGQFFDEAQAAREELIAWSHGRP